MDKLERLLNLTAALLETPVPLTAEELRQRIGGYPEAKESFRRSFERDKEDLREMGIPIEVEEVPGVDPPILGYRIYKQQYFLPDPDLDPDELAALHLAASTVRLGGASADEALRKLGGVLGNGEQGELVASLPTDPNLITLFGAVADHRLVRFRYGQTEREVEPWRVSLVKGRWYLSGFDRTRDDERRFRLDRIEGEVVSGPRQAFSPPDKPPPELRLAGWEFGGEEPILARLLVDPDQAAWAAHHVGEPVERRPDGSVVLELAVTNVEGFRSLALTFLDHAEVLSPAELRDDLVRWLERQAAPTDR